jgi:hypothetical protein
VETLICLTLTLSLSLLVCQQRSSYRRTTTGKLRATHPSHTTLRVSERD